MNKIKIERLDDFGRGIGYIDNKIVFVENALPGEEASIEITNEKKNFCEAKVIDIESISSKRIEPLCKYYNTCGGCHLLHLNYQDTLEYKVNKLKNIFKKNKIYDGDINIIENKDNLHYRNKIELKIENGKIGFYQNKSHDLVEINECLTTKECINKVIKDIKLNNGDITIRSNYNDEILLIVNTKDKFEYDNILKNNKIVGIIINDKLIYGDNHFVQVINNLYFKVSYNSFFQINEYICSKLFDIIDSNIDNNSTVLDLYCGVGTLSLVASKKANTVYGIEIVENAILNATINAKINKKDNLYFMCGDSSKLVDKIKDDIDTLIVDPPRSGLSKKIIDTIKNKKFKKIIYVSCDPQTLARDIKELINDYNIKSITALDMFSYTYHVETVCILERK